MLKIYYLMFFFIFSLFLVQAEEEIPSYQDFLRIEEIAQNLLKKFPPDKNFFIGLGRSPTPLITYFELTSPGISTQIPLSGFKSPQGMMESLGTLEQFNTHLRKYFPSDAIIQGKNIVLIDYASSGMTLAYFDQYLKKYLKSINRPTSTTVVALTGSIGKDAVVSNFERNKIKGYKIVTLKEDLNLIFYHQKFDDYSPVGRAYPHLVASPEWTPANIEKNLYFRNLYSAYIHQKVHEQNLESCSPRRPISAIVQSTSQVLSKFFALFKNNTKTY